MDERKDDEQQPRRPTEGVRIIGAEEAQAAIEAGHAAGRRPEDAPKYGDVPRQPEGPRPAIRFPLGGATDPSSVPRPGLSHAPGPKAEDRTSEPEGRDDAPSEPTPSIWSPPPATPDPMTEPAQEPASPTTAGDDAPPVITPPGGRTELPHWTEPPTGENPRIAVGGNDDEDFAAWQATAMSGPRWRGEQDSDWEDVDTHAGQLLRS